MQRIEHLFRFMELLIEAQHAGHKTSAELNRVIGEIMRELYLDKHDK